MPTATRPITAGIASVADMLAWTPSADPYAIFNAAIVPLAKRQPSGPLVFNCQGLDLPPYPPQGQTAGTDGQSTSWFAFGYWQYVDIFNFFGGSVPFTIPPPGWINAAHRNGVPMLGTFFAQSPEQVTDLVANIELAVSQLVTITKYYGDRRRCRRR